MRPSQNNILSCTCIALLSACSYFMPENHSDSPDTVTINTQDTKSIQYEHTQITEPVITDQTPTQQRQQIVEIGTGQYTADTTASKDKGYETEGGDITLNFQGTDIREFVKAILGDVLHLNYAIDPELTGTVTIETATPVHEKELFSLTEEVLAMNGAALINDNGFYRIVPRTSAVSGNLAASTLPAKEAGGYSVRIIPLAYIAAQEMQKILEPFLKEGSNIRTDNQRNLLILGGTPQELNQLQETINIFDVDWLRGMSVGLYPLDYVDSKTLKTELDSILSGLNNEKEGELLGGLVRTVTIERLNSILLISSTASALREAELWIYRLDQPSEQTGQRLYVYKVQNAKATELADILGNIFGAFQQANVITPLPSLAPGTTPVEIVSSNPEEGQIEPSTTPVITTGDTGIVLSSDSIKIIADDTRNALVVLASPEDYKMVEATIKKLDIVPLQVLIEASIIEVTLTDDLNYGVEWFFKNHIDSNKEGRGILDLGEPGISALAPGFSYTIIDTASNVRLAINALEEESDINVLSSPSLMVLDNQTAFINVGDSIPISTRSSISNVDPDAPTVNEIEYRETGVTLTVTPRVNSSGLVTMEIRQEVSDAIETETSNLDSPTLRKREIESVVAINSGETIVLGGLIRDTQTYSESGIPVLYKLPIIGKLFGTTNDDTSRTELLVLITPRVVSNRNEAKGITEEFRQKLKGIPPIKKQPVETTTDAPT